MNCSEIQELLSDYFDDELSDAQQLTMSQHLDNCAMCASRLARFEKLSLMTRALSAPAVAEHCWSDLERQLDETETAAGLGGPELLGSAGSARSAASTGLARSSGAIRLLRLLLAACILVGLGMGGGLYLSGFFAKDQEAFATHFTQYLDEFRSDPESAQERFLARFDNWSVAPEEAAERVGYAPAVARGIPAGYRLVSTHVISMPCCTCVQSVCKRRDGSTLAIFEHADGHDMQQFDGSLGDKPCLSAKCHGKDCCLMDVDDQLAATWKHGSRHITLVGINDLEEVNALVRWWDDAHRGLEHSDEPKRDQI